MAKVLCVLYDDPVDGYPPKYARDDIPKIDHYPDGMTTPTPSKIDFKPGELLGSVSGELGLRKFLEDAGHTLVVTADKDGANSTFDKELPDAEVVISQPFWPVYMTKERFEKALGLTFHPDVESLVKVCDVVTINAPLHPETEGMFNDKLIGKMKRGSYIVNTARGKICDRDAIVRALESGQLAGYAGDVWFPQPAPADHPWRH